MAWMDKGGLLERPWPHDAPLRVDLLLQLQHCLSKFWVIQSDILIYSLRLSYHYSLQLLPQGLCTSVRVYSCTTLRGNLINQYHGPAQQMMISLFRPCTGLEWDLHRGCHPARNPSQLHFALGCSMLSDLLRHGNHGSPTTWYHYLMETESRDSALIFQVSKSLSGLPTDEHLPPARHLVISC
ncbi:hypothetical protein BJX66DRAFT_99258 [Aspergillus keveii]|uniref:Uncharacterized protein n=1 Tax=Aspergillus keveii TaxID=714993 RepID=A0ABR4GQD3_9EURO